MSTRSATLSALYRARVAADPVGFSRMMSERTRKAWATGKLMRCSHRKPTDDVKIRAFADLQPRPPWKVLAYQLGVQEKTVVRWRREIGLDIERPRNKRYGASSG